MARIPVKVTYKSNREETLFASGPKTLQELEKKLGKLDSVEMWQVMPPLKV